LQGLLEGTNCNIINDRRSLVEDPYRYPNLFVGQIKSINDKNETFFGTGVLISKNCVLTVAHNIIQNVNRKRVPIPPDKITFSPGKTLDINPFGEIKIIDYYLPEEFLQFKHEHDWALLVLSEPVGLLIKEVFNIDITIFDRSILNTAISENNEILIIGYPGEDEKNGRIYESSKGHYKKMDENFEKHFVAYTLDTTGGQSGSPVFEKINSDYYIFGIHQRGLVKEKVNAALRISELMFDKISNFIQTIEIKYNRNYNEYLNDERLSDVYFKLGKVYSELSIYEKGFDYNQKALNLRLKIYGNHREETAISYHTIGLHYFYNMNYEEALNNYQKAHDIINSLEPRNNLLSSKIYNNIGRAFSKLGKYDKSLDFHNQSLDLRREYSANPEIQIENATTKNNIGNVYYEKGDFDNALKVYFESLDIKLKIKGENHLKSSTSYFNIGKVYEKLGNYEKIFIFS